MADFKSPDGISEIVGTMLILGISVSLFSIVYISLLSTSSAPLSPSIDIIGTIDENEIIIEHRGGKSVDVNAKLIIDIAGIREPIEPIRKYMQTSTQSNGEWDYGETLRYNPNMNLSDYRVDIGIADVNSNSLVLYSNLQSGYTVPDFGRGGIWHFNETSGNIAIDSSGNDNHGTIIGAERVTGINDTNGLFFNGLDDYVYVPDSPGLNIQGNMSIEAWVNAGTVPEPINQTEFDVDFGYYPNITHVVDDIYAIVYRQGPSTSSPIILKIIQIQTDGWVINASLDMVTVDSGGFEPVIIRINPSTVAVIYGDLNREGTIKTYNISDTGEVTYSGYSNTFSTDDCEVVSITSKKDNIFVIAYGSDQKNPFNVGSIQIVHIGDNGNITNITAHPSFASQCGDPDILKISNELYVITYVNGSDKDALVLETYTINETFQVIKTSYQVSYSEDCVDPDVFRISDSVIGVAFTNDPDHGVLRTYSVSEHGEISFTGNHLEFDDSKCYDVDVLNLFENVYAIAYEVSPSHRGKIVKINILSDGTIEKILSIKDYILKFGYEPNIFKISQHIFGIVFRAQSPHPGGLATFSFYNDVEYPYQNAGIYREEVFTLFANATTVTGGINDQSLNASLNPGWNHVALTYNQSVIALYVNGTLQESKPYSESLQTSNKPLYIGDYFYGTMDEVALFDHCLTPEEILNHFEHPGDFQ